MAQPPYPQYGPQVGQRTPTQPASYETRRDVEAALAAQHELGPEYADSVAAGLADRVEQLAAVRTAELRYAAGRDTEGQSLERTAMRQRFVTSIVSLGAGIPITAISGHEVGLVGIAVSWTGIVGVNVAQALGSRRRRS